MQKATTDGGNRLCCPWYLVDFCQQVKLAERFGILFEATAEVLQVVVANGLCVDDEEGFQLVCEAVGVLVGFFF